MKDSEIRSRLNEIYEEIESHKAPLEAEKNKLEAELVKNRKRQRDKAIRELYRINPGLGESLVKHNDWEKFARDKNYEDGHYEQYLCFRKGPFTICFDLQKICHSPKITVNGEFHNINELISELDRISDLINYGGVNPNG